MLKNANIKTTVICHATEVGSLYYNMATQSGGTLLYDVTSFNNNILQYIYGYIPPPPQPAFFDVVVGTGWERIRLDEKPRPNSTVDTDKDGLTDWQEIATDNNLLQWNSNGITKLPTVWECMEFASNGGFLTYVSNALDRFIKDLESEHGGYKNCNCWLNLSCTCISARVKQILNEREVLPIRSNPANADTDGDGYSDYEEWKVGTNPLTTTRYTFTAADGTRHRLNLGAREAIFIAAHPIPSSLNIGNHSCIIIFITPFSTLYDVQNYISNFGNGSYVVHFDKLIDYGDNGLKYLTIGAGPKDSTIFGGTLLAEINREEDEKISTKNVMIYLEYDSKLSVVIDFIKCFDYFVTNNTNISYWAINTNGTTRFNSNSFTHGLLRAVFDFIVPEPKSWVPGWADRFPKSYFGK
jgi:hypothetical protein